LQFFIIVIESQSTASQDKHNNYQDLKRTNKSDKLCSHWPFGDAISNVVEVGRGRRDLISIRHHRHHLVDGTKNRNLRETDNKSRSRLGSHSSNHRRDHQDGRERRGTEAVVLEAVARRCPGRSSFRAFYYPWYLFVRIIVCDIFYTGKTCLHYLAMCPMVVPL
jgi:hypothetical protein